MKLRDIDEAFVEARRTELEDRWSARNQRMDTYEKHYLLDIWESAENPDQERISPPICWSRVEAFRPLFLTKPPVLSVPASEVRAVEQERADDLEKYLYCAWYQARVMDAADRAEHGACLFGEGVIRCLYDDLAVEGEYPIIVQGLDPRNVYATPGAREGQDLEIVHYFDRRRRDIEEEWGELTKSRPSGSAEELERWLDEEVEFIDYWRTDVVEEEKEPEPEPEPAGVVDRFLATVRGVFNLPAREQFTVSEARQEEAEPEEREKVRRRVVTNAVLADGEFVKKPVRMPGYNRLPFIRYPGIATILDGEDGALSVLFPITGGKGGTGAKGIAAGYAELLNMKQEIIQHYANSAIITDTDDLEQLDFSLGAVNVSRGAWKFLAGPGTPPDVDEQMQQFEGMIEDATVSRSMMGRHVGDLSGLALSAINNPVLMKIAHRQQIRERAYEQLNELILSLTEEYAPAEGWYVWGPDRMRAVSETQLRPDQIQGYYRNRVELTASLPKDDAGEIMSMSNLVDKRQMSLESFLDQVQRIKRLSSQSPADEMKRILRDSLLFGGKLTEKLAELVAADWDPALAQLLQQVQAEQQGPPGAMPGGPPGPGMPMPQGMPPGPGMGPPGMQGMPPGVVPPGAMPPALPQEAMMAMMGQGMGGPPGA